ncbi:hypothetical protein [uncultured Ruegeria sp.]|uniref:hypothetical protein n=1 Tax=uncultured Ruegeria sp. TaxID=259304 RepID=UPI00261DC217|nr:hypothetical protein [uncultured Ruegeria sp.]
MTLRIVSSDAGVKQAIGQIDQQIDDNENHGGEKNNGLNLRSIPREDYFDQKAAETRVAKDHLDHHHAF